MLVLVLTDQCSNRKGEPMEAPESAIGQAIVFANVPVRGFFKYRDRLLLLPVPPTAPQAWPGAAMYPFILQFSYPRSENQMMAARQRNANADRWVKILNVLLNKMV